MDSPGPAVLVSVMAEYRHARGAAVLAACAAIVALALLALDAEPVLDDRHQLHHVAGFRSLLAPLGLDCFQLWRPAKNLLFLAIRQAGLPAGHVAAACAGVASFLALLCWLRRAGLAAPWAAGAAAVWALSPTQVSSLAWLSAVNIQAMVVFALVTLLCWRGDAGRTTRAWGLASFAAALLSYEAAVTLPVLWLLCAWHRDPDGFRWPRAARQVLPLAALVAGYLAVRHLLSGMSQAGQDLISRDVTALRLSASSAWIGWDHLSLWLWPFGRQGVLGSFHWPQEGGWVWKLLLCWTGLAGLAAAAWCTRRRRPLISLGLAWFLIAFLPTSNLVPIRCGPFADYFLVWPAVGLALASAELVRWIAATGRIAGLAAVALFACWRAAALVEAFEWSLGWRREAVLIERSLIARPDSAPLYREHARGCLEQKRFPEARWAVDQALRLAPDNGRTLIVAGSLEMALQRHDAARAAFQRASVLLPGDATAPAMLGFLADTVEQNPALAKQHYREALARTWVENSGTAAINLGVLLAQEGQLAEARAVMEKALSHMPRDASLLRNLAAACQQMGDADAARAYFARYQRAAGAKSTRP